MRVIDGYKLNGEIGYLVSETIGLIADSDVLEIGLKEKIFNKILGQYDNKVFDGWEDYRIDTRGRTTR